jgi:hypothetical protein
MKDKKGERKGAKLNWKVALHRPQTVHVPPQKVHSFP